MFPLYVDYRGSRRHRSSNANPNGRENGWVNAEAVDFLTGEVEQGTKNKIGWLTYRARTMPAVVSEATTPLLRAATTTPSE